jgi:hypothetical protein
MQGVFAGDIQVDFKGMFYLLLWRICVRNGMPIEPHTRNLRLPQMLPDPMMCQAALNALMKGGYNAKDQQRQGKTGDSHPPVYPETDAQSSQQSTKKDTHTGPTVTIATPIELLNALLQSLQLPLQSVEAFFLCNHKRCSSLYSVELDSII